MAARGKDGGIEFSRDRHSAAQPDAGYGHRLVPCGETSCTGIIAISSSTESALATSGGNTTAAISVAGDSTGDAISAGEDSTGNALEKSYRHTAHALGTSARHVGKALHITPKAEKDEQQR